MHPSWQDLGGLGECRYVSLCLREEENMWSKHKETKTIDIPHCVLRLRERKKKSGWWMLRKLYFVAQMEQSADAEVEMQLFNLVGLLTRSKPRPLYLRTWRNAAACSTCEPSCSSHLFGSPTATGEGIFCFTVVEYNQCFGSVFNCSCQCRDLSHQLSSLMFLQFL